MTQSIGAFEQDAAMGRWKRPNYDVAAIEAKAQELSASHSLGLGCRTLDIIHVAAALSIGSKAFVTFDTRQAALTKAVGLNVRP